MNQSVDGDEFRAIVGACKALGLIDTGQGTVTLTQLALNALDPTRGGALADAFLRVPLHAAMFKHYEGHALLPADAMNAKWRRSVHLLSRSSGHAVGAVRRIHP